MKQQMPSLTSGFCSNLQNCHFKTTFLFPWAELLSIPSDGCCTTPLLCLGMMFLSFGEPNVALQPISFHSTKVGGVVRCQGPPGHPVVYNTASESSQPCGELSKALLMNIFIWTINQVSQCWLTNPQRISTHNSSVSSLFSLFASP